MDIKKVSKDYRMGQWAPMIKKCKESGLTILKFCEKNGISENSYYYWQRKLRETACEALAKSPNKETTLVPTVFVEARQAEPTSQSIASSGPQYQVNIEARGVRLSASSEYPVEKLVKLLREAVRSC